MKQIRSGVFETNSSSTHSFSIEPTHTLKRSLVQDNRLHFEDLESLMTKINYDDWVLECRTYEEKVSLIIHAIINSDFEEPSYRDHCLNFLKRNCRYELNFDVAVNPDLYMCDSEEGSLFWNASSEEACENVIIRLLEYAKDDEIKFVEKYVLW